MGFSFAPHWLDAKGQWGRCPQQCFRHRFIKLRQACLVHGYLRGTVEELEAAHAHAGQPRLWMQLLGRGYGGREDVNEVYFELRMGPANAAMPVEAFLEGWRAFAREL